MLLRVQCIQIWRQILCCLMFSLICLLTSSTSIKKNKLCYYGFVIQNPIYAIILELIVLLHFSKCTKSRIWQISSVFQIKIVFYTSLNLYKKRKKTLHRHIYMPRNANWHLLNVATLRHFCAEFGINFISLYF